MTGVLDALVKRGRVCCESHPTDGRMVLVHLAKAGSRMADTVRRTVHRGEAEWMRSLSETERARLTELLWKLQRRMAQ